MGFLGYWLNLRVAPLPYEPGIALLDHDIMIPVNRSTSQYAFEWAVAWVAAEVPIGAAHLGASSAGAHSIRLRRSAQGYRL